ncbi:hypothetical protein [Variovorax atrisoli]|uniref:hypothetical protein n=1 Tax=Variovorax atrisoli TaxID=3394203 RepID=UPI000364A6E9|nr:hypothetical protein [Variovorax paradoxus]
MSDKPNDPIDLAAHRERRARLQQQRLRDGRRDADPSPPEPGPDEVPCARCGELIYGKVRQCPHCGVHFLGGAAVFAPKPKMSLRTKCIVVLVTLLLLYMGLSDDIARWWW